MIPLCATRGRSFALNTENETVQHLEVLCLLSKGVIKLFKEENIYRSIKLLLTQLKLSYSYRFKSLIV